MNRGNGGPETAENRQGHILVVDGSPAAARAVSALENASYHVEAAADGSAALEALRRRIPLCVVADAADRVVNGSELCRSMRKDERLAAVPVILLSGRIDAETLLRGLEAGADALLLRPFDERDLLERVRDVMTASLSEELESTSPLEFRHGGTAYRISAGRGRMLRYFASACGVPAAVPDMARHQDAKQPSPGDHSACQAKKMAAVGRLAAGVAHDLNNILQVIQGFADFLLGKMPAEDPARKPLQQIRASTEKAAGLTQTLLVISMKQAQHPQVLDLGAVVEGVAGTLRQVVGPGVAVNLRSEEGLWKVRADRGHLEQALIHLAQNAREAIDGNGTLTIETVNQVELTEGNAAPSQGGSQASVCCVVRDTGRGMNPQTLDHVFEPFFTTKEKGTGPGLGLATVYGTVMQSGGSIQCRSQPGEGTELRILLPRWTGGAGMSQSQKKILIADDDQGILALLRVYCEDSGYETMDASNGEEAVEMAQKYQPDVVLLDATMPHLDGFEATRRLKANASTRHIPVMMLTGLKSREDRIQGIAAGANDFLTKPIDQEELMMRIRNNLQIKEYHDFLAHHNELLEGTVARRTRELHDTLLSLQDGIDKLKSSYIDTIRRLVIAAEYKDSDTGTHIRRLGTFAGELADALGMDPPFVDTIFHASSMHDIGKVGIPDRIILKEGPLDPVEWEVLKTHTLIGARILHGSESRYLQMAERIASTHHERWDGSGYPLGLEGAAIPVEGRIVNVCDQYDALRSRRSYKAAMDHEAALAVITRGDGRTEPCHFDPRVREAFLDISGRMRVLYQGDGH